ncbi:hypothetical protein HPB48_010560 [Haemaphysalis longicornis]|uniref:Uncharacterized protein n=1 Tax=Haemaphysalis longicornis TaxID=44386 RepID=A0A9J6H291_HAELO|nr:hypothetical protein HPB48_010560 [Haemaphysalis longicornis]
MTQLIDEGVLDPSIRTLVFYSGFDLGLSRWYNPHQIRYPYEKVIYVMLRRFDNKARKLLKKAAAERDSEGKALSFADCFAVVLLNVIMEYMSSARLPSTTECGTAMDDFLEGMKRNLTTEIKRLRMHRSTIRYYTLYLAPVHSKVYSLKHIDTWEQKDGRFERTILMTEVEAYLKDREIKVALQEKSMNEDLAELRERLNRSSASIMNVVSDAITPVAAGNGILLGDVAYLRALVMDDHRKQGYKNCRITILNDFIFYIIVTIGTRKGSPFVQALDDVCVLR